MSIGSVQSFASLQQAVKAYQSQPSGPQATKEIASTSASPSFGNFVQKAMESMKLDGEHSEVMSLQAATGQANLNEVVHAVSSAEASLNTIVAVRDRMVDAYQRILSMPI